MSWIFEWSHSFKKQYERKEERIKNKIKEKLKELADSTDPLSLGKKKKNLDFHALDLTYHDRMAYTIDSKTNTIKLIKVCSHKVVYGKN